MRIAIGLIAFCLSFSSFAQPYYTQAGNKTLILEAMAALGKAYSTNPIVLDSSLMLGNPQLYPEEQRIFIPIIKHPQMDIAKRVNYGIQVNFNDTLSFLTTKGSFLVLQNLGLSVQIIRRWSGRFPFEQQLLFNQQVYAACEDLIKADRKRGREYLDQGKLQISGTSRVKFSLQAVESNKSLQLIARNKSRKTFQIGQLDYTVWCADTVLFPRYHVGVKINQGNPFETLQGKSELELLQHSLAHLKPGVYSFRIQVYCWDESWMDMGPTLVDGAPIKRFAKNPWTGISYTNKVRVRVDDSGKWHVLAEKD